VSEHPEDPLLDHPFPWVGGVSDEQLLRRPIGWWLKQADARLDATFDALLSARGVDRRAWQVLATLARSPAQQQKVVASLAPFDDPAVVTGVVDDLRERGWVVKSSAQMLQLTPDGVREQQALAPLVEQVRHKVADALPAEDYVTLVRLLARLVDALPETPG